MFRSTVSLLHSFIKIYFAKIMYVLFRVEWYNFEYKKLFVKLARKKHSLTCLLTNTKHSQQRQLLLGAFHYEITYRCAECKEIAIGSKKTLWTAQGLNQKKKEEK